MKAKKVILIDDEADIALYLQTALEDGGYTALVASGAAEGMKLIREEAPDLVCLDLLMPEETGMSLYQKIKSDSRLKNTPVVITSGLSLSRELKDIDFLRLSDGTVLPEPEGFIEKPIDVDEFLEMVKGLIG